MFLELSEIFVCPDCRPAQGLIVLVDAIEERRVREGHLGCPECETRVPIRGGVLRFGDAAGGGVAGARLLAGVGREEAATRLAALLGADGAEGCLLLGPGLEELAEPLARLAEGAEVLAIAADEAAAGRSADDAEAAPDADGGDPGRGGGTSGGAGSAAGVSRAVGVDPGDLPIVTGRLAGVALVRPTVAAVREAVRVLAEGGRAVLLEPSPESRDALADEPVGVVAAEEDAVVAVREPGVAPARS